MPRLAGQRQQPGGVGVALEQARPDRARLRPGRAVADPHRPALVQAPRQGERRVARDPAEARGHLGVDAVGPGQRELVVLEQAQHHAVAAHHGGRLAQRDRHDLIGRERLRELGRDAGEARDPARAGLLGRQGRAQAHLARRRPGEGGQHLRVARRPLAGARVADAEGAEHLPVRRADRVPGPGDDAEGLDGARAARPRVLARVVDQHGGAAAHHQPAERVADGDLAAGLVLRVEADGGLPERAPVVDQADEGQRGVEEGRGVGREAVERLLRSRVEQPRRPDRRNTLGVADGVHDTEG